ncbi:sigma 54-interacting transcriptional regulator [Bacillus sp. FJAT-29790]|uniref:sigma 54-interacting transcriptional regulator n=1 Tax=Bacillus sp. FJAT-29790 TaxID=1895002 RepID=UPI001C234924|nr:sigma 54-interacting transcriptional regulator [Bacillus sp. FJAT-29790]MBU8879277.1 sigma 54-interacting transcriptional regulator [Bacillus sp. FJAT-29790]
MTFLKGIQELVQQVADVISTALKVETEIVDETLTVMAGTGECRNRINTKEEGGKKEAGYLYGRILSTKQAFVVEDAQNDPMYDPLVLTGERKEVAEICCPILYKEKAIGVIGLLAFDQEQHNRLIENKKQMLNFLWRMSELITGKVAEMETTKQLLLTKNKLNTIVESIQDGILAIDKNGMITHCNHTVEMLLNEDKQNIIGRPLEKILPGSPMLSILKTGKGYSEKEEIYQTSKQHFHFIVTATPISNQSQVYGAVASIRKMSDVRKLAYSLTSSEQDLSFSEVKGVSNIIKGLKYQALKVSNSNSSIMLTGESGTGKGVFAMAIHNASKRASGPFISVNCGSIPETLLESELFGYVKGAFTGANKEGKIGKFEMADGGTIFLDEIGDLPFHLQVKLLHVLQHKKVERVGSSSLIPIDIKVIAATNQNLEKMVHEGEFRADLYFRLNVIPLNLPPLRERQIDIPILMNHFLSEHTNSLNKEIYGFEPKVIEMFQKYRWPGNVRELENAVEYAVNMEQTDRITAQSLPLRMLEKKDYSSEYPSLKAMLSLHEKEILQNMLSKYGHSVKAKKQIAVQLNISLATLYRKLEEHDLLNDHVYLKNIY